MKSAWRFTLIVLACSLIVLVAVYWQTAVSVFSQWRTATYSHQFLVVPLSLYLAWRRREKLARLEPKPSLGVLALLPAPAFAWLLGELTATSVVQQFCFVAMIALLIWGAIGTRAARVLLAPLVFLFFAVPAGDALIPWLQDFSAWFAVKALELTRVPVLLEGRILTIPSGKWEVAEACSGIHYLLATLTIGFVYADILYRKWSRKAVFLAASVAVPVTANGLRVYGILLTDYLGGTKLARGVDHVIAGWLFLSVITILLFAAGIRWREGAEKEGIGEEPSKKEMTPAGAKRIAPRLLLFAGVGLAVAAAAPALAMLANGKAGGNHIVALQAPVVALPWNPTAVTYAGWKPKLLPPDAEWEQGYAKEGRTVELYLGYYGSNEKGAKLVSSTNSFYDRSEWLRTGEKYVETTVDGKVVRVRQVSIQSREGHLVLWSWYWAAGEYTSNDYRAKWLLARARLTGDRRGSAAIVVATEEPIAWESGESLLRDFTEHLSLSECLDNAEKSGSERVFGK